MDASVVLLGAKVVKGVLTIGFRMLDDPPRKRRYKKVRPGSVAEFELQELLNEHLNKVVTLKVVGTFVEDILLAG